MNQHLRDDPILMINYDLPQNDLTPDNCKFAQVTYLDGSTVCHFDEKLELVLFDRMMAQLDRKPYVRLKLTHHSQKSNVWTIEIPDSMYITQRSIV